MVGDLFGSEVGGRQGFNYLYVWPAKALFQLSNAQNLFTVIPDENTDKNLRPAKKMCGSANV